MYTDSKGMKTYKLNRQSQNIIYILQLLLYTDIKLIEKCRSLSGDIMFYIVYLSLNGNL